MKRLFLFATAFFLYSVTNAQSVQFGLKAGVNFATLTNTDNNDAVLGFHGGGLAHIHITEHFAIQPELLLSGQGTRFNRSALPDVRWHLGYINVPILFQYMTGEGFRLETGPQFGVLPIARRIEKDNSGNIKDNFRSGDVSWAFGVGYKLPSNWGIDARYNLGISDVTDDASVRRNSVFQLGVFYQFSK